MSYLFVYLKNISLTLYLLVFIIFFTSLLLVVILRKEGKRKKEDKKRMDNLFLSLQHLSVIWNPKNRIEIDLPEIAGIWREDALHHETEVKEEDIYLFHHEEIKEFYQKYIVNNPYCKGDARTVINEICALLDREGECPSVVQQKGDPEVSLEQNVFDHLARITLLNHSIHVAEDMLNIMGSKGPLTPKIIITALGHDLGKLPSFTAQTYSLGDHPTMSAVALFRMKEFNNLNYKDEISKAIKSHHRIANGLLLAEKLKEADHLAREKELAQFILTEEPVSKDEIKSSEYQEAEVRTVSSVQKESETQTKDECKTRSKAEHIYGSISEKQTERPKIVDIPWFNDELFLNLLKPTINHLIEGRKWVALSMKEGYVYVQPQAIWETAKSLAKQFGETALFAGDSDQGFRQNVIYTIVSILRDKGNIIAEELIKEDYFGGPFVVTRESGRSMNAFYTPFYAEAFGSVSELEKLKKGALKKIAKITINSQQGEHEYH
jgi:hypothetical protein